MKRISVLLDDIVTNALKQTMEINKCSISDVVNSAILAFSIDKQPVIVKEVTPVTELFEKIGDVDLWCSGRNINKARLKYLVTSSAKGHNITGFGNTKNKWRDKQDSRKFKTHTSWIAHCLKEDFGIEL